MGPTRQGSGVFARSFRSLQWSQGIDDRLSSSESDLRDSAFVQLQDFVWPSAFVKWPLDLSRLTSCIHAVDLLGTSPAEMMQARHEVSRKTSQAVGCSTSSGCLFHDRSRGFQTGEFLLFFSASLLAVGFVAVDGLSALSAL